MRVGKKFTIAARPQRDGLCHLSMHFGSGTCCPHLSPRVTEHRRSKPRLKSGFTLLELMLVLVILVLLGAIAAPRLSDVFERQRLNAAASDMRLAWDEARLEAMKTGQAQVFSCTVGASDFQVKPLVLMSDVTNASTGATVMTGTGTVMEAQDSGFFAPAAGMGPGVSGGRLDESGGESLEEGLTFVSCLVAADMRAYSVAQESTTSGMGDLTTASVSQQVIFYPDGSTSTAELQIRNARGDIRAVRMRGLTGHTRILAIGNVASGTEQENSQ